MKIVLDYKDEEVFFSIKMQTNYRNFFNDDPIQNLQMPSCSSRDSDSSGIQ